MQLKGQMLTGPYHALIASRISALTFHTEANSAAPILVYPNFERLPLMSYIIKHDWRSAALAMSMTA